MGVAERTLSIRRGARSHAQGHQHQQVLSPLQEEEHVKWILDEEDGGRTPYDFEIRQMAEYINQANGGGHSFGKHWVKRFINRHPALRSKLQDSLEASRASLDLPDKIRDFQRRFKVIVRDLKIKTENIVNMDELGVQEGETKKGRVIGTVLAKRGPRKVPEATTWVTITEAITANGRRLTPVVIFTGFNLQGQWFPRCFPEWKYTTSKSGWSNAEIALEWLRKAYLPETKPSNPSDWRLLILDQHVAHITTEFMDECRRTPHQPPDDCWYTPKKGEDVQDQLLAISSQQIAVPRSIRTLFRKASKALDLKSAENAILRSDKRDLKKQLEALKPQRRTTVARDPNDIFPEIEQIMEAKKAAEASAKRYEQQHAKDFLEAAMEIGRRSMEDMQFQWQLE
ncbi:hypothetical protein DL770_006089 [Monosporascus sp. CRB-9-2]|nr:hypothetical protein DL770_006089 [Monosporascus sp. CRB-9-2]